MGDLWKLIGRGEDEVGLPVSSERRKRAYGLPASPIASSRPRQAGHPRRRVARQSLLLASAVRPIVRRMVALDRVQERRRAVALARHYRNEEALSIADIARRLGRAEATVKAYLYDPIAEKAREVKARYRGVCRGCGAPTSARNGKGDAYAYCKRCRPGAIERQWTRERSREAMRAWRARYGAAPSSYDWSPTHARRAAKRSNDYRPENGPRCRL